MKVNGTTNDTDATTASPTTPPTATTTPTATTPALPSPSTGNGNLESGSSQEMGVEEKEPRSPDHCVEQKTDDDATSSSPVKQSPDRMNSKRGVDEDGSEDEEKKLKIAKVFLNTKLYIAVALAHSIIICNCNFFTRFSTNNLNKLNKIHIFTERET